MSIKIRNIKTFSRDASDTIRIDRTSPLGNPFFMKDESQRELVCKKYERYFIDKIVEGTDREFIEMVEYIKLLAHTGDVTLLCWCYPKTCHGETIVLYVCGYYDEEIKRLKEECI